MNATASTSTAPAASPAPLPPLATYALLNSPSSSEQQIEEEIERIATGLFSVVATMGKPVYLFQVNPLSWHLDRTRTNYPRA